MVGLGLELVVGHGQGQGKGQGTNEVAQPEKATQAARLVERQTGRSAFWGMLQVVTFGSELHRKSDEFLSGLCMPQHQVKFTLSI